MTRILATDFAISEGDNLVSGTLGRSRAWGGGVISAGASQTDELILNKIGTKEIAFGGLGGGGPGIVSSPPKPSILHPLAGQASVIPTVVDLSQREAREFLKRNPPSTDVAKLSLGGVVRGCGLNMVVALANPSEWALDWASFTFSTPSPPCSVLSYSPHVEGVTLKVERDASVTLSPSITLTQASGSSLQAGPLFSKSKGWKGSYTTLVETVKGFLGIYGPGELELVWQLTADKAVEEKGGSLGHTAVVSGVALFQYPKGAPDPIITVEFDGRARRPASPTVRTGTFTSPALGTFDLKPVQ